MTGPAHDAPDAGELVTRRDTVRDFQHRWHRFARQWRRASEQGHEAGQALVRRALADGLAPIADREPVPPPTEVLLNAACAVVAASDLFDAEDYAVEHRLTLGVDPVRHFVEQGWLDLRAPSLRFDLWSYWAAHLDPTDTQVNPLIHYLLVGRHVGLSPVPEQVPFRPGSLLPDKPRRVCLFAAYDRDGIVDDYVVDYLTELARHADIYYLADGVLEPGELDKIAGVTKGAWAVPHAAYDFGSFSMLARDLVGWDVIDGYDEVILANDSCYLVRPLDDVFARMDAVACDWWSLQATSMEHGQAYDGDETPVPLAEAKERFVGPRKWTDVNYLHLSSYFLVYRRPVVSDPGFRFRLNTVSSQRDKMLVVHKYEVGISRYLMDAGFDFETYLPELHAFHPLYSGEVFDLIERGLPLVKRNYLGENPLHVIDLDAWPDRLRAVAPLAPVEKIVANIARVSPADRLHEAYTVRLDDQGRRIVAPRSVWGGALRKLDRESPAFGHWWAFCANPRTGRLDPGLRAVFEQVRHDPSIRKVVLTGPRRLDDVLEGDNVTVLPLNTVDGQRLLVRCARILVDSEPNLAVNLPLAPSRHDFIHVGIGLPVLAHSTSADPEGEWRKLEAMAVASQADALVRVAAVPDLELSQMWATGLPRHDLLLSDHLPADLAEEESRIRDRVGDRRLVMWWAAGTCDHTADEMARISEWARAHEVVIGVRETRVDRRDGWTRAFGDGEVISLSARSTPWSSLIHRVADAVVTDRVAEAFDALVLGTPVIQYAARSAHEPRSTLEPVFEGDGWPPVVRVNDTDGLLEQLGAARDNGFARSGVGVRPGIAPLDGHAAWRFAQRLRELDLR
ncbi:rhamnan synthesis F family protein [Nocardioides sp.]|uniref:rhamnan synthesis F family protein n=1 Tax=Nocardioides sp. TaxID=35761 RepID=UPI002C07726C|nr:rhamnan synthesis F family protein [Nocardioides sp.]HXH79823.1 rhamnan synthesis F family protein [Nocardioides sp.]